MPRTDNPFLLENESAYLRWRDEKLASAHIARDPIAVNDPRALTPAEHQALLTRCKTTNMAVYAGKNLAEDPEIPKLLGRAFGLLNLDANWLAGEDGITEIKVQGGTRKFYIPYTERAIHWHTDGYYNPPERTIRAMVLHAVRPAKSGGENRLMDPELVYLHLRDENPAYIAALSAPDAMTIPERMGEEGVERAAQSGPVFSLDSAGKLHMRYTARTRSIEWKNDPLTREAVACLEKILATSPHIFILKLEAGMGILCNNVLHDRASFTDDPEAPRLLYRARFLERIN